MFLIHEYFFQLAIALQLLKLLTSYDVPCVGISETQMSKHLDAF